MYTRLLKDASLYSLSSLLARGFSLITVPVYTRILTPADYGALDLLSYLAVLVPLMLGAALDQAVARFYLDAENEDERRRIASTVLFYTLFVYCLFIPVARSLAEYMATDWLAGQVDTSTVLLVFAFIWLQSIFYIANNQLKFLFLSKQFAFSNIGNTLVSVALGFVLVVHFGMGIKGLFVGQIAGRAGFALVSLYLGRHAYAFVFHPRLLRRLLAYSLPLVPGTLAFFVMQYIDRYLLNELSGLRAVGIYGIGARLASLVNLLLMGFQGAWTPIVMKHFREEGAPSRFRVVLNHYVFVLAGAMLVLSLFGHELLSLLTTAEFSKGFVVVPLLIMSAIMASIANYFTYGIQIKKKSSYRLYLNLGALVLNIVLNLLLIPRLGITGSAVSTAATFLLLAVVGMIVSQRLYYVPYNWGPLCSVGLLVATISQVGLLEADGPSLDLLVAKLLCVLIVIALSSKLLGVQLRPSQFRRILTMPDTSST